MQRSYLFNDIIAFWSLIQPYRGSCLSVPKYKTSWNCNYDFSLPFNVFNPFYGLKFCTTKLRVLRTCRSPVSKVACWTGQWYILVAWLKNTIAPGRRASDFASPAWIPLHIHGFHWKDKDFFPHGRYCVIRERDRCPAWADINQSRYFCSKHTIGFSELHTNCNLWGNIIKSVNGCEHRTDAEHIERKYCCRQRKINVHNARNIGRKI